MLLPEMPKSVSTLSFLPIIYNDRHFAFLVNIFSVVRFPNTACIGTDTNQSNGTCYTSEECSRRGGSAAGSCAGGYGVCCSCKLLTVTNVRNFSCLSN